MRRMQPSPSYQPQALEDFAAQLEAHARSAARGWTVVGAVVGGVVGATLVVPLDAIAQAPPTAGFATTLLGLLVGGLLGRTGGKRRAHVHRLHAQSVLSQLHAQRATLAIWRLLRAQQEQAQAQEQPEQVAHAASSPEPVPAPPLPYVPVVERQVAAEAEPVSQRDPSPLVDRAPAPGEPANLPPAPALGPPVSSAVVHLVPPQPVAGEVHPLFPAHSGVGDQAHADHAAHDAPPLVPPATEQPEPLNPWVVPPLAPPA